MPGKSSKLRRKSVHVPDQKIIEKEYEYLAQLSQNGWAFPWQCSMIPPNDFTPLQRKTACTKV
jgi:hypothetical protein